ncbi:hypothetical protein QEN19_003342 [Hanseniaspora menglaensis]
MNVLFECSLQSHMTNGENNRLVEFIQAINSIQSVLANNSGNNCVGNIHMDRNGVSFIYNNVLESIKIDVFISNLIFNSFKYEQENNMEIMSEGFTSIYINYSTLLYSLQNIIGVNNNYDLEEGEGRESEILIHYSKQTHTKKEMEYTCSQKKVSMATSFDKNEEEEEEEEEDDDDKINETIDSLNLILQDDFMKELISLKTFTQPINNNILSNTADFDNLKFDCILNSKTLLSTLNNLKPFQQHIKNIVLWFKHINLKPMFKHRDFFTNGKVADHSIKLPNVIFFNRNDDIGNIKISILNDINKRRLKKQKKKANDQDFAFENSDNIELLKFNTSGDNTDVLTQEAILLVDFKKLVKIIPVLKITDKILIQCDNDGTLFIQALVGTGYANGAEKDRISIEITIPTKDIEVEENISVETLKSIITDYVPASDKSNKEPVSRKDAYGINANENSAILDNTDQISVTTALKVTPSQRFTQGDDKKDKKKTKIFF